MYMYVCIERVNVICSVCSCFIFSRYILEDHTSTGQGGLTTVIDEWLEWEATQLQVCVCVCVCVCVHCSHVRVIRFQFVQT